MTGTGRSSDMPEPFRTAVASLTGPALRPEVTVREAPAPNRLAPYAVALTGEVPAEAGEARDLASGRLVVLHDPDGQEGWDGTTRMVAYVRAGTDLEIAVDPLLPAVGWSWLVEALEARNAGYTAAGGTVTRVASERFGALSDSSGAAEVEVRAAWTPLGDDLAPHAAAWTDLLCVAAGLPPRIPGVVNLSEGLRRGARLGGPRRR